VCGVFLSPAQREIKCVNSRCVWLTLIIIAAARLFRLSQKGSHLFVLTLQTHLGVFSFAQQPVEGVVLRRQLRADALSGAAGSYYWRIRRLESKYNCAHTFNKKTNSNY